MRLFDTEVHLAEISSSLASAKKYFAQVDATDNATMTADQRTVMRNALAEAEALIDSVRKQLYDAQK